MRHLIACTAALAVLLVVIAHGGCGGDDIVFPGGGFRPTVLPTGGACKGRNQTCVGPLECCSRMCEDGICDCAARTEFCSIDANCCSGSCNISTGACN
jgi:hypothetical protein